MKNELVIVLDFGGQYNQLVARRVRECNVYCEIYSYKTDLQKIKDMNPKGIILTGGPNSCYEADSPTYTKELFELGIPVLGLCYGAQLMMHVLGGEVKRADVREYGKTEVLIDKASSKVFEGVSASTICWMSHFDYIAQIAPGFEITAHTADCPVAAAENAEKQLYAIQFHPEVLHTVQGKEMLSNFVRNVCGCAGDWKMDEFVENSIKEIRAKVGDGKVLCALSGGVDSSVAAVMLSKAIGNQLTCVFVDHGLLRKNEGDEVEAIFGPEGDYDLNFIRVNAQQRFYEKLAGVTEPEQKRKIIGEEFIRVFEEEAKKIGTVDFLVQGTIYPDVVESGLGGESAVIKSHHNVGGLPDYVDFKEIIEPLRDLFKDEVRKAGLELGLPERLVFRQPFPGPGLGIRITGECKDQKRKNSGQWRRNCRIRGEKNAGTAGKTVLDGFPESDDFLKSDDDSRSADCRGSAGASERHGKRRSGTESDRTDAAGGNRAGRRAEKGISVSLFRRNAAAGRTGDCAGGQSGNSVC